MYIKKIRDLYHLALFMIKINKNENLQLNEVISLFLNFQFLPFFLNETNEQLTLICYIQSGTLQGTRLSTLYKLS